MAFSNIYDDTFPADTELANLIGANLRQVRLDVQQRMAAISGLSTSMPAFASDAQPANWNGILFFATDTGHVYQFNNPTWTDITTSFFSNTGERYLGTGGIAFSTNTNLTNTLLGNWGLFAAASVVVTLPLISTTLIGQTFTFAPSAFAGTVAANGSDTIFNQGVSSSTVIVPLAGSLKVAVDGSGGTPTSWKVVQFTPGNPVLSGSTTATFPGSGSVAGTVGASGTIVYPNGWKVNWAYVQLQDYGNSSSATTWNFPTPFTTGPLFFEATNCAPAAGQANLNAEQGIASLSSFGTSSSNWQVHNTGVTNELVIFFLRAEGF